jgi:hypothetical protein
MLRHHALVYDGFVTPGVATHSGIQHADALALGDQIGLQALVDRGAGGAFTAAVEHSGDGIAWMQKNPAPEIDAAPLLAGRLTSLYGGEAYPSRPSLTHVRIRIEVTPPYTGGRAHVVPTRVVPTRVRLHAVIRERGKGRYASCGCTGEEGRDEKAGVRASGEAPARRQRGPRPHASMAELERRLLGLPVSLDPAERLRRALAVLGERERLEVMAFLSSAG